MRKIFGILLALALVVSFSVVATSPVAAATISKVYPVDLGVKGNATAALSDVQAYTGSLSVHLQTFSTVGTGDEGRVVINMPAGTTLADILPISWQEYLAAGYPPHVDIILGSPADALVVEYAYNNAAHYSEAWPTYGALTGAWYPTFNDDGSGPSTVTNSTFAWLNSGAAGPYPVTETLPIAYANVTGSKFVGGSLENWQKGNIVTQITGNTTVLRLEFEVDNWIVQTNAYIDAISVAGISYAEVTTTAIAIPPNPPFGVTFPYGMVDFSLPCKLGQTVTFTIALPGAVPVGTVWWKYDGIAWYSLPNLSDDGDNIMVIKLTDGGLGDADRLVNGVISDPGGPGNPLLSAGVVVSPDCACAAASYTITFTTTASLTEGVHSICIEFPSNTTVPATFATGKITVNGVSVFGSEVTVTGNKVCFLVPTDFPAGVIQVVFSSTSGIKNPCVPGKYNLYVNTSRAPDATPVKSASYTIKPAQSSYGLIVDFGPTYPGIAEDFVPPFKACGQNDTAQAFNTTYIAPYWYDQFDLVLVEEEEGCALPCANATLSFNVTEFASATAGVNLQIGGDMFTLNSTVTNGTYAHNLTLVLGSNITLASLLHFDTVGDYTICFDVTCPGSAAGTCPLCAPATGPVSILTGGPRCITFHVYQQKDAFKMTLCEKWNLISLPLVPLGQDGSISIDDALASMPAAQLANLVSIWYYDCTTADWVMYPGGGLTTLEDGKAYWMRFKYPLTTGCCNMTWWVWGTEKPEPPAAPSQYPVCEGWNMVGYTELTNKQPNAYLWNWNGVSGQPNPVVYGYTHGCWNIQGWDLVGFSLEDMVPGQGYWVAFPTAGAVYVP